MRSGGSTTPQHQHSVDSTSPNIGRASGARSYPVRVIPGRGASALRRLALAFVGLLVAYLSGWRQASGDVIGGIVVGSVVAYGIYLFATGATRQSPSRHS